MKRPLTQILCLLLLASLLAGCGSDVRTTGPKPSAPLPIKAEATASPEPTPTPDPEEEARKQRLEKAQDGFVWEDGYLYAIDDEGNLKTDCWIGVLHFDKTGRYTSGSKELDILVAGVIDKNTTDSMTRMEKLRAVYNYTRDHIQYVGWANHEMTYQYAHGKDGWMIDIAIKAIEDTHGNCYYFAAEFTALARGLGYQAYAVGGLFSALQDPHGWVVILDENGTEWICDPEMEYRLQDWKERGGDVDEVPDCFYRNQEELEFDLAMSYSQSKDPFEPERKEAEERAKPASAKTKTGTGTPTPLPSTTTPPVG
ncbi:MAG: transglutaminase domain-containing protein [Oscillospiraceae bacterium]|nr:transglutaminase domain-containing protein [Oscillospiraceae bacterium]